MKIIFIGKNTSKPKTISFTSFVFIISILFCLTIFLFNYFFVYKNNKDESFKNLKLTSETFTSKQGFGVTNFFKSLVIKTC